MTHVQQYGKLALVAGASEGIGAAAAHYLASAGMDLIVVARKKETLEAFALLLTNTYKVKVECICCDLSDVDASTQIIKGVNGREVDVLFYNAALSYIGPFEKNSMANYTGMAYANMITPMNLVHVFGEQMLKKGKGALILMASLAGFQGSGFLAGYAATKAFNRVLAESLWYEWKGRGVDVIACCAGATATPNFIKTQPAKASFFAPRVQSPEEVVKECFEKLGKQPSFITGFGNKFASFIMQKLFSRKMAVTVMGDTTRKMYRL